MKTLELPETASGLPVPSTPLFDGLHQSQLHPSANKFHVGNGEDGRHYWLTPWKDPVFVKLAEEFGPFDLDPCAPIVRPWDTAARHFTIQDNGLLRPWQGRVWCNPPYGRETGRWLNRCAEHGNAVALIFARTETADWVTHVWGRATAIMFLFGRLHFHHVNGKRAAANSGAPSALVAYGPNNLEALMTCGLRGRVVVL